MDPTLQAISKQTEIPVSEISAAPTRHPFHKTPILLMSLFVLLVIGAFFAGTYYQGMNTKKEVAQVIEASPMPTLPTPMPDPTVGWKKYASTGGNYSLQYPQSFILYENKIPSVDGAMASSQNTVSFVGGENDSFNISITFDDTMKYSDLDKFIGSDPTCGNKDMSSEEYVLGGVTGRLFVDTLCGPIGESTLYFLNNGVFYTVHIVSHEPYDKILKDVDQILKTFTFTNTTSADDLTSFASSRCGLDAGYPKGWSAEEPSTDSRSTGYPVPCIFLTAPDFKITGMDSREGLSVNITSTKLGTTYNDVTIQNLENYITATEKIISPVVPVKNKQTKKYGTISGTYFEWGGFEEQGNFIFIKNGSVVEVSWPLAYTGQYKTDVPSIIASIKDSN